MFVSFFLHHPLCELDFRALWLCTMQLNRLLICDCSKFWNCLTKKLIYVHRLSRLRQHYNIVRDRLIQCQLGMTPFQEINWRYYSSDATKGTILFKGLWYLQYHVIVLVLYCNRFNLDWWIRCICVLGRVLILRAGHTQFKIFFWISFVC